MENSLDSQDEKKRLINILLDSKINIEGFLFSKTIIIVGYNEWCKHLRRLIPEVTIVGIYDSMYDVKKYNNLRVQHINVSDIDFQKLREDNITVLFTSNSDYYLAHGEKYANAQLISHIFYRAYICEFDNRQKMLESKYRKILNYLEGNDNTFDNIYIVGTLYGLLLYILYNRQWKNTLFIIYGFYPFKDVVNRLRQMGVTCVFVSFDESIENESVVCKNILCELAEMNNNQMIYGQDTVPYITLFFQRRFTLIEDGKISYISEEDSLKLKGFSIYIYNENVNNIIFAGLQDIPPQLNKKAEVINFEEQWAVLSALEKDQILNVFGFDYSRYIELIDQGRNIVIFTRNYSKVKKCSYNTHILMYRELISKFDENKVMIKPHPNDEVEYDRYFDKCIVLPKDLPAEIMLMCQVPIKTAVSIDDSSNIFGVMNNGAIEVKFYPELLKKYNIIKIRDL